MANDTTTTEQAPPVVGFDSKDFHAFTQMLKNPDAKDAAEKAWSASPATEEVTEKETESETEVEEAATGDNASEAEEDEGEEIEGEEGEHEEAAAAKPKRKSGYVRKIEKLERQIAELTAAQAAKPVTQEATKPASQEARKTPPKLSEFDYDEDKHAAAMAEYFRNLTAAESKAQEVQREHQERINAYAESEQEAKKAHPDYDEVMENVAELKFGPVAVFALVSSDNQAELAYAISKQPELAKRIADLSNSDNPADHLKAARLMGLVEGKLEASASTAAEARTRTPVVSKAPPPGKPINGSAGGGTRSAEMILDEFASTGDVDKARRLATEYEKKTGKRLI